MNTRFDRGHFKPWRCCRRLYDIHLNLSREDFGGTTDAADGTLAGGADVLARVRASIRGIGLRLEPAKAREDVIVIDAAVKPSGN